MGCSGSRRRCSNGEAKPPNKMFTSEEAMSVLAVTPSNDNVCSAFASCCERLGMTWQSVSRPDTAMQSFIEGRHDVILIDRRTEVKAADSLVKSLRAVSQSECSTFVAIVEHSAPPSLENLLPLGYDMKFQGSYQDSMSCDDLLLTCHRNCFRHQQRLLAMTAAFTALENTNESVEITDSQFRIQYANAAYERMFGYTMPEVVGKCSFDAIAAAKSDDEVSLIMKSLRKGKQDWSENLVARRKSGAATEHRCRVYPVRGRRGHIQHFVSLKSQNHEIHKDCAMAKDSSELFQVLTGHKDAEVDRQDHLQQAPIHKVMSLITQAQSMCNADAQLALNQVKEILRLTSDLYTSEVCSAAEDKMAADYVEGLMTGAWPHTDRRQPKKPVHQVSLKSIEPSAAAASDEQQPMLENCDNWTFDIIRLEAATDRKPLVPLAGRILRKFRVHELLNCDQATMTAWLQVIQENYLPTNFYHNATHGADVMQCAAFFLERDRVRAVLHRSDVTAILLAALVHDIGHPGRTNPFLINRQHRLALLYNDISVLESHHASLTFQLTTSDSRINIFKNLSSHDYKEMRRNIVDIVLATEMAKHFEHVTKFTNQVVTPLASARESNSDDSTCCQAESHFIKQVLTKSENRILIKRVLIKCADISNQCRPLHICKEWSRRISEEYFEQTDEEKQLSLPIVMPTFDRNSCNLPQTQIGFIDFFLRDMIKAWHAFCEVPMLLEHMHNNYTYWQQLAQQHQTCHHREDEEEEKKK